MFSYTKDAKFPVGTAAVIYFNSIIIDDCLELMSYSDKRKQLLKMTFLVNEQNVSVMYTNITMS